MEVMRGAENYFIWFQSVFIKLVITAQIFASFATVVLAGRGGGRGGHGYRSGYRSYRSYRSHSYGGGYRYDSDDDDDYGGEIDTTSLIIGKKTFLSIKVD